MLKQAKHVTLDVEYKPGLLDRVLAKTDENKKPLIDVPEGWTLMPDGFTYLMGVNVDWLLGRSKYPIILSWDYESNGKKRRSSRKFRDIKLLGVVSLLCKESADGCFGAKRSARMVTSGPVIVRK
jgi:hypothetical protein